MTKRAYLAFLAAFSLAVLSASPAAAQYFGRNKVQYDKFQFKVLATEHFDIYYYPVEEQAVQDVARMAERWYERHSRTFLREFKEKKPVIIYANDADFQQTNAIGGFIGEGTGGVTEALKQRVVMPLTGSYKDTDHVLGHELTHSFQYDIAFADGDSTRFNIGLLPLWMVEGMAEYLSVGRVDSHTAMWLRDAALRDDLPSIDQLTHDTRYFPYRYGQAYMAYIGGKYGDGAVASLYKLAGIAGVDSAMVYALGITPDSLSKEWRDEVKATYLPLLEGRTPADSAGRLVLASNIDAGNMNVAPAISPDGKYIAFISERDLLDINLFIADAETGKIVEKLIKLNSDSHFDALRFISSSGSWSPDGRKLAFVTFSQGDNEIAVYNVDKSGVERHIAVKGIGAISNPAWSPDGKTIAFSGIEGGISDLYLLDVESQTVRQLTRDRYSDFEPTWSPDGKTLAFMTDEGPGGTDFKTLDYGEPRLAIIDVASQEKQVYAPFGDRVLYHNPQFSPDGRSLFFISDQDGFKDVYRLSLDDGQTYRITNITTGVSGITNVSPAMTVAAQSGRMVFSVYSDNGYNVFSLEPSQTSGTPVTPLGEGIASASILPPLRAVNAGLVGDYLNDPLTGLPSEDETFATRDYKSRLHLDYVAPPTVGASFGGPFGSRLGGGIAFFFSDMLGNQNLALVAQANGTFKDVGGQAAYVNQGHRFNYGGSVGHIPILYPLAYQGYECVAQTEPDGSCASGYMPVVYQFNYRIFVDQVSALAAYPFSTTRRLEANAGFIRYGFNYELEKYYFSYYGTGRQKVKAEDLADGDPLKAYLTEPPSEYFFQGALAYVVDYSQMGFTSPISGGRYRFQIAPMIGSNSFVSITADYRRYLYLKPFTLAVRALHIGNYGANETRNNFFWQEYLGYPYYQGFVRGYSLYNFDASECSAEAPVIGRDPQQVSSCVESDRLAGSRIAMGSAELRIPLLGYKGISLLHFPYLPTELTLFTDAGVAWTARDLPVLDFSSKSGRRSPVVSSGISTRVNILGAIVLEVYYAYPFQRPEHGPHFGWLLMPGW
ncbi:MAG TPA: peptidase S9 [Rhodothermales bacterium]|nr:peptidase S9 [Rhodothermales bacterium]